MLRDNDVRPVGELLPELLSFNILCGTPPIEQMIVHGLKASGFRYDLNALILLLVDAPTGFAMRQLATLDQTDLCVVVTTYNHHPEYWQDVLELHSAVLLVGDCCNSEVEDAIIRAANGEHFHRTPKVESPLTPTERAVLRYVARGWSNKRIAAHMGKGEQTIANTLNSVYSKLHLNGRVAAAMYYWGRSDLVK